MNDVRIIKKTGGLGRRADSGDAISGFIANGVAVTDKLDLGAVYRVKSIDDVLALGIDAKYDADNEVLVFEHLNEVFRINPNADVFLMLVSQTVGFDAMVSKTNANYAKKLLIDAEGKIKQLAVAYNPDLSSVSTTPTADTTGLEAAITAAQGLVEDEYAKHRPLHVLLEGKLWSTSASVNLKAKNAEGVSVMVGQSHSVATINSGTESSPIHKFVGYAAVGALLGAVSAAAVNENIGWVKKFNVYGGSLADAAIGGKLLTEISSGDIETQHENGAIFYTIHAGKAGIYFNDSFACTEATSDFAFIENSRVMNKAVRAIRQALLPRLNSPVLVDQETGFLSPAVVKSIEMDGRKALEELLSNQEVSGIDVYVNPEQNILSTSELLVSFEIVPTGTARTITATIGFKNPF
jgi:hypothetical protein